MAAVVSEALKTEEASPSTSFQSRPHFSSSSSSSEQWTQKLQNLPGSSSKSPPPTPSPRPPSSVIRLWRPAAQRNLRNQWSSLASCRQNWVSSSSSARSHATSLVNAYLSQRYMDVMDLGVLSDMPDIRKKACSKIFKQQGLHRGRLLSSYKDMVVVVTQIIKSSRSMRCFLKGTSSSPLIQFSSCSENANDTGDGGGIRVSTFCSISSFEKLAEELAQMYSSELNLKRLIVVELLSLGFDEFPQINRLCWSNELYSGEFDDLSACNLFSSEDCEPFLPKLKDFKSDCLSSKTNRKPDRETLQVYLTTWLVEVNIDTSRVDEIFALVGEELHVTLS